jgi:hypothetical protein
MEARHKLTETDRFKEMNGILESIFTTEPVVYMTTAPSLDALIKVVTAPVTEVYERFYPADSAESVLPAAEHFNAGLVHQHGNQGAFSCLSSEVMEKDGLKVRAVTLLAGWDSYEAHMAVRQSERFADNVQLIQEPIPIATDMKHFTFSQAPETK